MCSSRCSAAAKVQFHSTSITTFRSRNADFIKSGQGMGIAYLAPVDPSGKVETNPFIKEMPSFPDLYREIHGKPPSGRCGTPRTGSSTRSAK